MVVQTRWGTCLDWGNAGAPSDEECFLGVSIRECWASKFLGLPLCIVCVGVIGIGGITQMRLLSLHYLGNCGRMHRSGKKTSTGRQGSA